ncbi:MAG: hypothetical protein WAM70_05245 [Pyrinomonadaceae bacterium]
MSEIPPVLEDELLARFIKQRNHIRGDKTVKPNAFIPYPWPNLSVTRHAGLEDREIWELGQQVADAQSAALYGRADVEVRVFTAQSLTIAPTLTPRNHANITGWPPEKPLQKIIAQEIAAEAKFVGVPDDN